MRRLLPLALSATLLACDSGSSSGDPGGGGGDGIALADLCTAWGDAYCRAAVVCGGVVEAQVAECARVVASDCDVAPAQAQVRDGRVDFDGAAYRRCLERFAVAPVCGEKRRPELPPDDADCRAAAVGTLGDLDDCGDAFGPLGYRECRDGRCFAPDCDGFCEALPGNGDACYGPLCRPGLRCLEGTCRPYGAEGEPCERFEGCAGGLYCRMTVPGSLRGVCSRPLPAGAECDAEREPCAAGHYCPMFPATPPAVCTPLADGGEPCEPYGSSCRPGLYCPPETNATCLPQQPVGETCVHEQECLAPATCDGGLCVILPIVGEPCLDAGVHGACAAGWCDGATCRRRVPNGEPCTYDDACGDKEASCVQGTCAGWCSE